MKVTIVNVAEKANVSITTVSKILNNKADSISQNTIDRVMRVVEELNYTPNAIARSMITKKTGTIGLILPDISNLYFSGMARGVENIANRQGYHVIFCNTDDQQEREKESIQMLREKLVDGIIMVPALSSGIEHIQANMKNLKSYVLVDRVFNAYKYNMNCVYVDNVAGGYEATKYLIEQGHKKIACITGYIGEDSTKDRLTGYKNALQEAGIPIDRTIIMEGKYRLSGGERCAEHLMEYEVDAIFVQNDLMACGVYRALQKAGKRIPDDISVVGYDNVDYSVIMSPTLTTVEQHYCKMGETAANNLIHDIEGKAYEPVVLFTPELVIRESVADRRK